MNRSTSGFGWPPSSRSSTSTLPSSTPPAWQYYGLREVDQLIRERVVEVVERDFAGVNLEVRLEPPDDFSLYSEVEIGGPDPNGRGLIGYDNTPGKDVGNLRLHDRIGGVNATTQQDGFPGFGGVFIESLFVFSEHPGDFAPEVGGQDELFDDVFDEFRPDRGGEPVTSDELTGVVVSVRGQDCPAEDRARQIGCAVRVLGSLVGTTVSHELGHSLGLANPGAPEVHNLTDGERRLMDSGGNRTFRERAELAGEGPSVFCDSEFDYLKGNLAQPRSTARPSGDRPACDPAADPLVMRWLTCL